MNEKVIIDRWTGEKLAPGNPEACAGNVERGGHCCDECDYFLKCFPEFADVGLVWEEIGKVFDPADVIPE